MPEVQIVARKIHREKDAKGRKQGHIGEIETRGITNVKISVGGRYAAWIRPSIDNMPVGHPLRFKTFSTKEAAVEYVITAVKNSKAP